MRYNVGDVVRIRKDIIIDKKYNSLTFYDNMYNDLYGKDLVIIGIDGLYYIIDSYYITDEMLENINLKYKIVAVDLDETLVYSVDSYPYIKEVNIEAIVALVKYKNAGGKIILWTLRTDEHLNLALEALSNAGLKWDAINTNLQESIDAWESKYPNMSYSPKICCDLFIDDRAYPANIIGINWKALEKELLKKDFSY